MNFDLLYETKPSKYELPNPMRKSSEKLYNKNAYYYELFQFTQFPTSYWYPQNEDTGIIDRRSVWKTPKTTDATRTPRYFYIVNPTSEKALTVVGSCDDLESMRTEFRKFDSRENERMQFYLTDPYRHGGNEHIMSRFCQSGGEYPNVKEYMITMTSDVDCYDGIGLTIRQYPSDDPEWYASKFKVRADGAIINSECTQDTTVDSLLIFPFLLLTILFLPAKCNLALSTIEDNTFQEIAMHDEINFRLVHHERYGNANAQ